MSGKNRTGRPLKQHPEGTQVTITLQVPAELKTKLQAQAIRSNRSLSQEAERRLERSFSEQALQQDAMSLAAETTYEQIARDMDARLAELNTRALKEVEALRAEGERQLAKTLQRLKVLDRAVATEKKK